MKHLATESYTYRATDGGTITDPQQREKMLQNFMAPEDRGKWGERQTDELFGSLFGQRMGLGENLDEDEVEIDEGEKNAADEEAGLMMFRQ